MKSAKWENIFKGWNRSESKTVVTLKQVPIFKDFFNNELSSPAIGTYPFVKYNSSISDATNQQGFRLSNFSAFRPQVNT